MRIPLLSTIAISLNRFARKFWSSPSLSANQSSPHSSVNETICHGIPDHRKLKEGDIINLGKEAVLFCLSYLTPRPDVSLYYDGLSKC